MLENLFNLIREHGGEAVINNPAVPNEQNDAVLADATHSVTEGLQGAIAGGGLQNIMSMFGSGNQAGASGLLNNPIVANIIQNFTQKLTDKHGIASDQAGGIANNLIPGAISSLINKTNDPNDSSFDLNGIIGSLTGGGQAGGLGGLVSKFTSGSLDSDGDGKIELSDIVSKVTGDNSGAQGGNEGGGLMDAIKGFMK